MTFEIALTGINAASTQLDAISNNIANNATSGFKRSRAEFSDVYAKSSFSSSNSNVGQGVRVSEIRQEYTQGDMEFTNRNLDLAVEGLGFFKLNDNGNSIFTRSGNFGLDREGFLVNTQGNQLMGYGVNEDAQVLPIQTELKIDYTDLQPTSTTEVELAMNLDTNAAIPALAFDVDDSDSYNFSTSILIYDSLGSSEISNIYFRKDTPNSWSSFVYVGDQLVTDATGVEITFGTDGKLTGVNGAGNTNFDSEVFTPVSGAEDMFMGFDFSEISQYDNAFGVNRIAQDGFAAGRLEDFDIDAAGIIFGRFSNGQAKTMGQVTLSNFANEAGLRQTGTTSWAESYASGEAATGAPGSASLGNIQSGALEGSNVDITQELVAMIGAQRSFQANAQVISTGDTLTQTVINIRR